MKSSIGSVLRGLGYLFMVLYFIGGFLLGSSFSVYRSELNWGIVLGVWLTGFTLGALLIGIGTIIDQLSGIQKIYSLLDSSGGKSREFSRRTSNTTPNGSSTQNVREDVGIEQNRRFFSNSI